MNFDIRKALEFNRVGSNGENYPDVKFMLGAEWQHDQLAPLLLKAVELAEFVIEHSMESAYNNEEAREFLSELRKALIK